MQDKDKVKYEIKVGGKNQTIEREALFSENGEVVELTNLFKLIDEKPILYYLAETNQFELIAKIIADIKYGYHQKGHELTERGLQNLFQETIEGNQVNTNAFLIAIEKNNTKAVETLFQSGYKLTQNDANKALKILEKNKDITDEICNLLLNEIEKSEFQSQINTELDAALTNIITQGHTNHSKYLINYYNRNHLPIPKDLVKTALDNENGEIVKLLIEANAPYTEDDRKNIATKARSDNEFDTTVQNYKDANNIIINKKIALYFSIGISIGVILLAGAAFLYPQIAKGFAKEMTDNAYNMIKEYSDKIAVKMAKGTIDIAKGIASNPTLTDFIER